MNAFYITSLTKGAGKTAVALSLAGLLKAHGKSVGYFKPSLAFTDAAPASDADADAVFAKQSLGLAEPITAIGPVAVSAKSLSGGLGQETSTAQKKRWVNVSKGKDVVFVEGLSAAGETAVASKELAALCDAKVVLVAPCTRGMSLDGILSAKEAFGERFFGVVLNSAPEMSLRLAREEIAPALTAKGVRVLGVIPQDRLLLSLSVADYTHLLGGRVLNNEERVGELVEHVLLGANVVDSSEFYYERVNNKALITRSDRPDLQWNALGEKTKCVILTGGKNPIPYVVDRAAEANVPVVVVPKSTAETLAAMEGFVTKAAFHYPQKLARFTELLRANADLHAFGL